MKIYIDKDTSFTFCFTKHRPTEPFSYMYRWKRDISSSDYKALVKAEKDYWKWQDKLTKLVNS